MKMLMKRQGI